MVFLSWSCEDEDEKAEGSGEDGEDAAVTPLEEALSGEIEADDADNDEGNAGQPDNTFVTH